jgi:hypothetical protein
MTDDDQAEGTDQFWSMIHTPQTTSSQVGPASGQ